MKRFKENDRVKHTRYGIGSYYEDMYDSSLVNFEKYGIKRCHTRLLTSVKKRKNDSRSRRSKARSRKQTTK